MTRTPRNSTTPWSDQELLHSIEIYLLLLRMQIQGNDARSEPAVQMLVRSHLPNRNEAAIRYRMRNISFVMASLERPTLRDFSPANGVGTKVAARIEQLLRTHPYFPVISPIERGPSDADRADASRALARLRSQLEGIIADFERRGHNGPPDLLSEGLDRRQLQAALNDIDTINLELNRSVPDLRRAIASRNNLRHLLGALGKWIAVRATKFVDAALVAAGPVAVAELTGLLPTLVEAIEATSKWIGH